MSRKVGAVAYELELPPGNTIHNVVHVSCLKKVVGQHVTTNAELLPVDEEGQLILIPKKVLEMRERKLRNRSIMEYLIKWKSFSIEDATWEGEQVLQHPGLELLVGKQFPARAIVMSPSM
jgi:hypothetical protein